MDKAEFQDALDAYTKAYALKQNPALLYNQGRALQALHRMPDALAKLRRFKREAPADLLAKVPKLDELIDEVAAHVSTLALAVDRAGASVKLDDLVIGTTPLGDLAVNAGKARLEVSLDGYDTEARDVILPGNGRIELKIDLVPKDRSATLLVRSHVAGASVAIDGAGVGAAPSEVRVAAGTHRVRLTAPDHEPTEVTTVVKPGETKQLELDLPSSSVTKKAWFWVTVIGAPLAIAGIAGGTVAAVSEGSADRGTIQPGQLKIQLFSPRVPF